MAKILIAGQAVVVTSSLTLDEIAEIKKYRPEALVLYEGEGPEKEPVFKIGVSKSSGKINTFGAEFGGESHDEEKLATLTMVIPETCEDVKGYVVDAIGASILKLNKLEESLPGVLNEIKAERAQIDEVISVVG